MSIDMPKPANSNTKTVYAKTAKETLVQCDVRCNSIHKSIK